MSQQALDLPLVQRAPLAERLETGRAMRTTAPRSSHAELPPRAHRPDPVALIRASNQGRLPDLVPIRHARMAASPFAFLRGSAAVMAEDLCWLPSIGVVVQLCGDCHLMNFGMFATPERNVVFGLNDFDETLPGPWEWDVKRLAASIAVAGLDARMKPSVAQAAAVEGVAAYRTAMWAYAERTPLDVWYDRIDAAREVELAPDRATRQRRARLLEKARSRVAENLLPRIVRHEGQSLAIVDQPPLLFHPAGEDLLEVGRLFLASYRASLGRERRVLLDRYDLVDAAVKVVGVGSVGTRCFVVLLATADDHALLLQVKEANPSVLARHVSTPAVEHDGERIVVGQRLMQPASDIFLGWGTGPGGRHFYVRQLRDMKLSLTLTSDPTFLTRYASYCGRALARAHANSGDAALIAGYLGKKPVFDDALGRFAMAYAAQTDQDHARLVEAIRNGEIEALDETV